MLRTSLLKHLRTGKPIDFKYGALSVAFSSSKPNHTNTPNTPLKLDPSYEALFKDIQISLKNAGVHPPIRSELEVVSENQDAFTEELSLEEWSPMEISLEPTPQEELMHELHRKSPAALFGSNRVSMVVLPEELQDAINVLISNETKGTLRSDSVRLFKTTTEGNPEGEWDSEYDTTYSSREKANRHSIRDGMAFATVALPPHYSAITSVLNHVKLRLEPDWEVNRIIDWGAGTGSGLWAATYAFQGVEAQNTQSNPTLVNSSVKSYLGIDKREGLVSIGKRLVAHTPKGALAIDWKKSFKPADTVLREEGPTTIAMSAFALTSLPNPMAQKTLVQEMWDSGAHTLVLIDHNTNKGFEAIAHAREYLLRLGRDEVEEPETAKTNLLGSHALAPCPHDGACPLLRSGRSSLTCGFTQRLQRPPFVRLAKQSGVGHEDIEYSYVVIRRGPRPDREHSKFGRVGAIGKKAIREEEFANAPMRELEVQLENETSGEVALNIEAEETAEETAEAHDLDTHFRREAHHWPRLVFQPLKKSGHIILDTCTHEGKIMRITIPKSQGKQPFYDARKSSWGDLFPHEPKNRPIERTFSESDIGKRKNSFKKHEGKDYGSIAHNIRQERKLSRRDYAITRGEKVWED